MKIILIGATGQLGSDLAKVLPDEDLIPFSHGDIEICDHARTREILMSYQPDVVINTAAYHQVDQCEQNVERTFEVNTYALRNLAWICRDLDATLLQMSTDYVFGGEKKEPYVEEDLPHPLNVYGISKLAGEYFVQNICEKHFIVRSSGLYGLAGSSGKGGNFVELMLRLAQEGKEIQVVDDQVLTPTYTMDLARKIKELIATEQFGLYHITNNGQCSWYEFAKEIFEASHIQTHLHKTTTREFGASARRPKYSVLRNRALEKIGMDDLRTWKEALRAYLLARSTKRQ